MAKSVLSEPHFQNEAAAFAYGEARLWPAGPVCHHCGERERIVKIAVDQVLPGSRESFSQLSAGQQHWVETDLILANGFIVTSLLWGTMLAHLIDGRIRAAAAAVLLASVFAWFGVIHSPLPGSPILAPAEAMARLEQEGRATAAELQTPYHMAAAYAAVAVVLAAVGWFGKPPAPGEHDVPHAV